ncbi:MAG: hypothetical protein NUW09_00205 [Deltaproteobacteria bacterium]|nr:hypothetical protein [Deltaproteobacteria bacterium]
MKLSIPAEVLKAATVYTSKDEARHNINCLSFEDGRVIATNGTSLLVWRHGATLNNEGSKDPDFLMSFDKVTLKFVKAADCRAFPYDTETRVLSDGYGQSIILPEPPGEFIKWRHVLPSVHALTPGAPPISTKVTVLYEEYAKARQGKNTHHGFTVLATGDISRAFYLMPYDLPDCFIVAMPLNDTTVKDHLETIAVVSGKVEQAA